MSQTTSPRATGDGRTTRAAPRRRRRWAGLLGAALLGAGLIATPGAGEPTAIDRAIARMSTAEKIGQLIMMPVAGTRLSSADADLIRTYHIGGVIMFRHNYAGRALMRSFTQALQRAGRAGNRLGAGLLISVDQEGGVVKRFPDLPPWRSHPQIGRVGTSTAAFDQGAGTGAALRGIGVNMDLAPVGDLVTGSGVMAQRSFGSYTPRVARLTAAFSRGLASRRVVATVKHFPGFGGASINSDDGPATIGYPLSRIRREDMAPFASAVAAGAGAIMISHGRYVNAMGSRPASLDARLIRELLRTELGFGGVAISDSLNAIAWYTGGVTARACAATIDAGVDIALHTGGRATTIGCFRAIRDAVRAGRISPAQLDAAVRRILQLKVWAGVFVPPPPPPPPPPPSPSPSPSPSESPSPEPSVGESPSPEA